MGSGYTVGAAVQSAWNITAINCGGGSSTDSPTACTKLMYGCKCTANDPSNCWPVDQVYGIGPSASGVCPQVGDVISFNGECVQIIGEDKITEIGSDTLYFIVSVLNQLNLDKIRNRLILKVLPLKV